MFDFETFGDSPACLDKGNTNYTGQIALSQGIGKTEKDELPEFVLESNVTVISDYECANSLVSLLERRLNERDRLYRAFPQGLTEQTICSKGIYSSKLELYSVS